MNKFLIIYNPISGVKSNKNMIKKLEQRLIALNKDYKTIATEYKGHAESICGQQEILKYDSIIICGGDGTFNEAVNGLMKNHKPNDIPKVGFLPGGTGNAFMHDLNLTNPDNAIDTIIANNCKKIDILKLEHENSIGYSMNIVGWGMVTDILILAEKMRFFGSVRYTLASLFYIFFQRKRTLDISVNNKGFSKKSYIFILITNTIHTGKGMRAAPDALLDDGKFDVVFLKSNISKLKLLMLFPQLFSGNHIQSKYVKYIQAKNIELNPDFNEVLNIDGEVKEKTPVKISIMPKSLFIYRN